MLKILCILVYKNLKKKALEILKEEIEEWLNMKMWKFLKHQEEEKQQNPNAVSQAALFSLQKDGEGHDGRKQDAQKFWEGEKLVGLGKSRELPKRDQEEDDEIPRHRFIE